MERYEWTLHLTTDAQGQPEFAWLTCEHPDGQTYWVADSEFGPFDVMGDVGRWVSRHVSPRYVGVKR